MPMSTKNYAKEPDRGPVGGSGASDSKDTGQSVRPSDTSEQAKAAPSVEEMLAEARSMYDERYAEATVLSMIFQRHYLDFESAKESPDNLSSCICGGWSEGSMEPGWDDHLGEVAVEAGFHFATLSVLAGNPTTREAIARKLALVDDENGCFERVDEWEALEQWERDAQPQEEPMSDREDCEYWLRRADAVMPLVAAAVVAQREQDARTVEGNLGRRWIGEETLRDLAAAIRAGGAS